MTHITTDLDEGPIIRLCYNLGVEEIFLMGSEQLTSSLNYLVFLNGKISYGSFNKNTSYTHLYLHTQGYSVYLARGTLSGFSHEMLVKTSHEHQNRAVLCRFPNE